jgi:hypothetical protein
MTPDDRWDERVREEYDRPLAGEAEARERVIARLRREPPPRRAPWTPAWWTTPFAWRMPPALAAAAVLATLGAGIAAGVAWRGATHEARVVDAGATPVTFVFRAPGAATVALVGDFNGWDPQATPLARAALGDAWTAEVALPRGLHVYAFVIDGRDWASDPSAPLAPDAAFGRRNSVVVVGEDAPL